MFRAFPRVYANTNISINLSNNLLSSRNVIRNVLFRSISHVGNIGLGKTSRKMNFNEKRKLLVNVLKRNFTESPDPEVTIPSKPITISIESHKLLINWQDNQTSKFHNIWLRDHCKCENCYHHKTKQRLVDTFKIPEDIKPLSASPGLNGIEITSLWDARIEDCPPTVQYEDVMQTKEGLSNWLKKIDKYGFCFVDGVPPKVKETEELAKRICFIRESHYGGFWDFTSNLAHGDTAYTTLALKAHTDNTYFTDPSGLQMFHLIEFEGKGGSSLLIDGFSIARKLKMKYPEAYKVLSTIRIPTHSAGDSDVLIQPTPLAYPILNHNPLTNEIYQIRYNNDDRSTLNRLTSEEIESFYDSIRKWNKILVDKENEYWVQLEPGRVLIFDNWRVLHGRAGFTGHRRLIGAYLNWDDYRSKLKISCLSRQEIEEAL
ncbi:16918_t:CDS:2 [Funneliformis geosporum]|uniref:trimethyllysine dioxygenase n=1 Tax=Funneliformis geosporum TaxID=1117311 RepID=A0A9W4SAD4_9GLOM|nr:6970_t:CDS:2 [Funneliformis geosporum]CAI2164132.1 16918_t:CDS:2 [Funneliformis geosporum]